MPPVLPSRPCPYLAYPCSCAMFYCRLRHASCKCIFIQAMGNFQQCKAGGLLYTCHFSNLDFEIGVTIGRGLPAAIIFSVCNGVSTTATDDEGRLIKNLGRQEWLLDRSHAHLHEEQHAAHIVAKRAASNTLNKCNYKIVFCTMLCLKISPHRHTLES